MRILKNILAQLHRFVFWALILSLLWAWIYTYVGDTSREKKVLIYVDAVELHPRVLGLRLEDMGLPEGIEMIEVRGFDYDMFGSALNGDIYLTRESVLKATLDESPEKLASFPLPEGMRGYEWNGRVWGILAFDPETQVGPAMDLIRYAPEGMEEKEAYYLCFEAAGPRNAAPAGGVDPASWEVGIRLLGLREAPETQ